MRNTAISPMLRLLTTYRLCFMKIHGVWFICCRVGWWFLDWWPESQWKMEVARKLNWWDPAGSLEFRRTKIMVVVTNILLRHGVMHFISGMMRIVQQIIILSVKADIDEYNKQHLIKPVYKNNCLWCYTAIYWMTLHSSMLFQKKVLSHSVLCYGNLLSANIMHL